MVAIADEIIKKLREAGLYVSENNPAHGEFTNCVFVNKPISTPGNKHKDYRAGVDLNFQKPLHYVGYQNKSNCIVMDAPFITFYISDGKWVVVSEPLCPDPCPGDFENHWENAEDAIADILDFYLGNVERMNAKFKTLIQFEKRLEKELKEIEDNREKAIPLDDLVLQRLKDRGLLVTEPYQKGHALEYAVWVTKPTTTIGNSIQGYSCGFEVSEKIIDTDAPALWFYRTAKNWIVYMHETIPKMADHDFLNVWKTEDEAINDICDFYLGDPTRMKIKEKARLEVRARIAKWKEENQS